MMEQIKRNELKKISREFRTLASRVLNAHFKEINVRIKMLIDYIDGTPLLKNYIDSLHQESDMEEALNAVVGSYGRLALDTGDTPQKEVNSVYQALSYIAKHQDFPTSRLGQFYATSTKYQDMVEEFGSRVVNPFVDEIDDFLVEVSTDMGLDETKSFHVTVNGGSVQVNVANDQSQLHAEQLSEANMDEVNKLLKIVATSVSDSALSDDLKKVVSDQIRTLQQDTAKPADNKGRIKTALNTISGILKTVPTTITAIEAIAKLGQMF